ncbi:MAG TPA: ribonuclease HI family protein [Caldisericia bacterium]|jgi:ribonuclease HI|nr:ribonuclease HI family protein [Caldisericia bacterium]HXK51288.1 ribonuclease HI family protein [Caldisericia bacterium]
MINVFTDGASRSNPGLASCAYIIQENDTVLHEYGKFLGIQTNNFAEYTAVLSALEKCQKENYDNITLFSDSLLVVNQCNHIWKVKSQDLFPIYKSIMDLLRSFRCVKFVHIPREKNKHADRLCNEIIDQVSTELK